MNETNERCAPENKLQTTGALVLRYGLVVVIAWVGCLKFTAYEADGVFTHASHSPLLAWAYSFLSVRNFSRALGAVELTIAFLIVLRQISPKASLWGSVAAICMFLTTLSFLFTTPGVWQEGYGFPALSGPVGQFLAKDLVLLGAAVWTAGEALCAVRSTQPKLLKTQPVHLAGEVRPAR